MCNRGGCSEVWPHGRLRLEAGRQGRGRTQRKQARVVACNSASRPVSCTASAEPCNRLAAQMHAALPKALQNCAIGCSCCHLHAHHSRSTPGGRHAGNGRTPAARQQTSRRQLRGADKHGNVGGHRAFGHTSRQHLGQCGDMAAAIARSPHKARGTMKMLDLG